MKYFFDKTLNKDFDTAVAMVTAALKEEGFGILTEIDVRDIFKKKLDVDFRKYKILGACNPQFAYQALASENKIGVLLPCNVIVQELSPGVVEVAAVDPEASMQAVENFGLNKIASEVKVKLQRVVEGL